MTASWGGQDLLQKIAALIRAKSVGRVGGRGGGAAPENDREDQEAAQRRPRVWEKASMGPDCGGL